MAIGVTLLFKERNNKVIKGIIKSIIVNEINSVEYKNTIDQICDYYDYNFLGINDIFITSELLEEGAFLGRTTYYDLNSIEKSKQLIKQKKDYALNSKTSNENFNCSLIYHCKDFYGETFTVSILTIITSSLPILLKRVTKFVGEVDMKERINKYSIDKIDSITYVGIEDICDVDLKFGVFQTFYSDFETIDDLKAELMSEREINETIKDISSEK